MTIILDEDTSIDGLPIYPLWKASGLSTFRFIRDTNEENPYFWVSQPVEMIRTLTDGDKVLRKRTYYEQKHIFQVLVVHSQVDEIPDGTVCKMVLWRNDTDKMIMPYLCDPNVEHMPDDYDHGADLHIIATPDRNGNLRPSDARWENRSLSQEEREIIDANRRDLSTLLNPNRPKTIKEAEEIRLAKLRTEKIATVAQLHGQRIITVVSDTNNHIDLVLENGKTFRIEIGENPSNPTKNELDFKIIGETE